MGSKRLRVHGHTLVAEGKPFNKWGVMIFPEVGPSSSTVVGRARCSCGVMSEPLGSDRARIRWHIEHKKEMASRGTP